MVFGLSGSCGLPMEPTVERLHIGAFRLIRPLEGGGGGWSERWMALDERSLVTHLAYRFRLRGGMGDQRRFLSAVEAVSGLRLPHVLPIEYVTLKTEAGPLEGAWLVTPFTGNLEGLVTLESLLLAKGGRMSAVEVERAIGQVLETIEAAHAVGQVHGALRLEEILVDPRGSVVIELYGLRRRLMGAAMVAAPEAIVDEVRSVVAMAYRLLTGVEAGEPAISASRLSAEAAGWETWFEMGLDPLRGFTTAGEAAGMMPMGGRAAEVSVRVGPVGAMWRKVRRVLGVG